MGCIVELLTPDSRLRTSALNQGRAVVLSAEESTTDGF
jgi:hypothetical protein